MGKKDGEKPVKNKDTGGPDFMTICGYTLTRYSRLLLTVPRFVQGLDRSNTLSSPIVLSQGHTLERESRLALWKHGAPWKHGSVKGGKVERPFYLGEEHTELTLCLSYVHLRSSAGDTMHTSLKAKSPDMVEGKTKRLALESQKTPHSCTNAHYVVCSINKLVYTTVYTFKHEYYIHHTVTKGKPSNKGRLQPSTLGIAFGLLGNKGMHAYNGNMWMSDISDDYSYSSLDEADIETELDRLMEAKGLDELNTTPIKTKVKIPPSTGQYWEEVTRCILAYEDLEERLYEDTSLLQAISWDIKGRLEDAPTGPNKFNHINALVEQALVTVTPDKGKFINWNREAYKIANEIDYLISDPGEEWLKKIPKNPWLANDPKAQKASHPPGKHKVTTFTASSMLSLKTFTINKCHTGKINKTNKELTKWAEWALLPPPSTYTWWLKASPNSTVGDTALGAHKANLSHSVHLKGPLPTFPSLPLKGGKRETSTKKSPKAKHGHFHKINKCKAKPKPKATFCQFVYLSPGTLDTFKTFIQRCLISRSSASESGV